MNHEKLTPIIASAVFPLVMMCADVVVLGPRYLIPCAYLDVLPSALCLVVLHYRHKPSFPRDLIPAACLLLCALSLIPLRIFGPHGEPLKFLSSPLSAGLLMIGEIVTHDRTRFRKVSKLFRSEAVMHGVKDDAKVFYSSIICFLLLLHCRI